jgi:hypothetical protein
MSRVPPGPFSNKHLSILLDGWVLETYHKNDRNPNQRPGVIDERFLIEEIGREGRRRIIRHFYRFLNCLNSYLSLSLNRQIAFKRMEKNDELKKKILFKKEPIDREKGRESERLTGVE